MNNNYSGEYLIRFISGNPMTGKAGIRISPAISARPNPTEQREAKKSNREEKEKFEKIFSNFEKRKRKGFHFSRFERRKRNFLNDSPLSRRERERDFIFSRFERRTRNSKYKFCKYEINFRSGKFR